MIWTKIMQFFQKWWKLIAISVTSILLAILICQIKANWRVLILHDSQRVTIKVK